MPEFVQRTTAPDTSNTYFYADNPFYQSGYGLPNCTCYAFGRFWEITGGAMPKLSWGNAEDWYGKADGYARGKTPKLGAVICWRKGVAGNNSDGAGHVAIVEQINDDGSIITSESGWGASSVFWRTTRQNDGNWGASSAYVFQGFIYNPADFDGSGYPVVEPISGNRFLTMAEMEINARYIWNYLGSRGWSINAVAGMLGNFQTESTINPGIWEGLKENVGPGFGLVQWTHFTRYTNWCAERGLDPAEMDSALQRIEYELETKTQYYPTKNYPETFAEFKVSTKDPYYLGMAFLANYERPLVSNQPARGRQAEQWYEFLSALPAPDGNQGKKKRKGLSLLLMYQATRRRV